MAAVKEHEFLGQIGEKEYYVNTKTGEIEYRVPTIRDAIEARPGYVILSADFSQIEIKIMAFVSGDQWLIKAINSGKDIHSFFAVDIYGEQKHFDYEQINQARKDENHARFEELSLVRSGVKSTVFGIPYGASPQKVAQLTGLPIKEVEELFAKFLGPGRAEELKRWMDKQGRDAPSKGFSTSLYGRKRFFPIPASDVPKREELMAQIRRWAGNAPIQGSSADMTKLALVMIYERLQEKGYSWEDAMIMITVHDEILVTCREEIAGDVHDIMKSSMEEAYNLLVKGIVNEVKVLSGKKWQKG